VDADAAIVRMDRDIASETRTGRSVYLTTHRFDGQEIPNTGVLMVRATKVARAFLDRMWNRLEYVDHIWWENAAALDILGYEFIPCHRKRWTAWRLATRFLSNEWNSIPEDPALQPRIVHFPGRPLAERITALEAALRPA
jgi:hypothetical protein